MSDNTTMTRRQLYEEIWSTPLGELSAKYGLPSEVFARACKRHSIPRPSLGYWSKKRAGWADPPPPLPPMGDPELETVSLTEEHPDDEPDLAGPVRHAVDDEVNRRIEEELAAPPILVPARLQSPHRFVAATIQERVQREADDSRRKKDPSSYHVQEVEPQIRANVSAHSKETRERAYRIIDTLFKALEERGYEVGGTPERFGGTTLVTVLGVVFDVRLHEPCRRQVHLLTPDEQRRKKQFGSVYAPAHDMVPTGRLCLEFRTQGGWMVLAQRQDGERVKLENSLKDLIVAVLRKVDAELQAVRDRERKAEVQREAEARQRQEAQREKELALAAEQEKARVQALLAEVKRWRDSQEIRAYLDEVRRVIAARGQVIEPGSKLAHWMDWAGSLAHTLDPLRPSAPPAPTRPAGGGGSAA
jgi:hypothetical protein